MVDTANLYLPFDRIGANNLFDFVPQFLTDIAEHKAVGGRVYLTGNFGGNYKAVLHETGLSLKGSIAKFYLPNNFDGVTCNNILNAIEMVSDGIHLPMNRAIITRLDLAHTFETEHPPEAYYIYLGESKYYLRNAFGNSLYYLNKLKTKCLYNKILESEKNGVEIPINWKGKNALRFEFRLMKRIAKQLKINELTPEKLSNQKFYFSLINLYCKEYEAINKINLISFNPKYMKSPKDVNKQLQLLGIESLGGETKALELIEQLRLQNGFEKPEYYSRAKKGIKQLCKNTNFTEQSEMIIELNLKIQELKGSLTAKTLN